MTDNFLLSSPLAIKLYNSYAKNLPIIDFHNHIGVSDVAENKQFENITKMWLSTDPYKHRLMRICGIPEHFISGDAPDREKFIKFATVFPFLGGTPVYEWSMMELHRVFGIDDSPCAENAEYLYDKTSEMLASSEFGAQKLLQRFGVEYQSPVASLTDSLAGYDGVSIAPSLRGDNLLRPTLELIKKLSDKVGFSIESLDSYTSAIAKVLDEFCSNGCAFADHALDDGFIYSPDNDSANGSFIAILNGENNGKYTSLESEILRRLAGLYAERNMTMLLHLGAKRQTSARLARLAGPVGGYAAIGTTPTSTDITYMLGNMESTSGLPRTVLFPLNISHAPALAALSGSFSEDGVSGKVQLGPAWWWCDHISGIKQVLDSVSSYGVLSEFIGMTTDSRSFLSFARHEYFRRYICSYIAELATAERFSKDEKILEKIINKICYSNAKNRLNMR